MIIKLQIWSMCGDEGRAVGEYTADVPPYFADTADSHDSYERLYSREWVGEKSAELTFIA